MQDITDKARFERMAERLLLAGWLKKFSHTDGGGWTVVWVAQGAQRAILLKRMITSFNLHNETAVADFTKLAQQGRLPVPTIDAKLARNTAGFWCDMLAEVGLAPADDLMMFAHIILKFAPDENSRLIAPD